MLTLARFIQRQSRQALRPKHSTPEQAEETTANRNQGNETSPPPAGLVVQDVDLGNQTPLQPQAPPQEAAAAPAAAAAAAPARAAPAQLPQPPLRHRIQGMAGSLERFIVRHRTSSALLFAYCSFFWRLFGEVGKLGAELPHPATTEFAAGSMFLDAGDMPLTRASVLARVAASGVQRKVLSREPKAGDATEASNAEDDDALALLEESLRVAASQKDPVRRAHLLAECYAALGRIHSARGHYYEMLHAMSLALRSGADTGDSETVSGLQIMLGHLELNHHRYYAAGTRFQDAMQTTASNKTTAEALAGLGWAQLAQGNNDAAGKRFMASLGITPKRFGNRNHMWTKAIQTSASDLATTAASLSAKGNCTARQDGLDGTRTLSLAGLAIANVRKGDHANVDGNTSAVLLECAVFLFHGMPSDMQEPHVWRSLGLARHVLSEIAAAKRYHLRAVSNEFKDLALATKPHEPWSCATAADLPSCSHHALHLGLVDFSAGNASLGMQHVEQLVSRTAAVPVEAAEWLTRFARAHSWTPSGRDFTAFLLGRAEPLLKTEGEARLAKHYLDYGRFLLAHRESPARLSRALRQLNRARAIIEKANIGWADAEIASLYSMIANVQHQLGEIEEAARSFEKALDHNKKVPRSAGEQQQKRLLLTHASLGAVRLQLAGTSPQRWRIALEDLREGRRVAQEAGISVLDPTMQEFEASFRNAMRLAHHRGMLATCPGPLDDFLYGPSCPKDE